MGGRGAGRKPWTIYEDRGVAFINTRIGGARVRESLGLAYDPATASARDVRVIEQAAAERYAKLVVGRRTERGEEARVLTENTLLELVTMYMLEATKLYPKSWKTRRIQLRNAMDWASDGPRWATDRRAPVERLLDEHGPHAFAVDRLQVVTRDTVNKETSAVFGFLEWCVAQRFLSSLPARPKLPRGHQGVRSGPQREEAVQVTHVEALAIIAEMPEFTAKGGRVHGPGSKGAIRVRDFARLLYETGLRPSTVMRASVPEHWSPGQKTLRITADIDKAGNARHVTLTKVALGILARCAPAEGPIFGVHDLRHQFKAAALKVLPEAKALSFARYDLRHGSARHGLAVSGGNLLGVAHQLGHTRITTTNHYLKAGQAHGTEVAMAMDSVSGRSAEPVEEPGPCADFGRIVCSVESVRRRGLEPLRCYPLAPQGIDLRRFSGFRGLDKCQTTTETATENDLGVPARSAIGQQAAEWLMWGSYDALELAWSEDES